MLMYLISHISIKTSLEPPFCLDQVCRAGIYDRHVDQISSRWFRSLFISIPMMFFGGLESRIFTWNLGHHGPLLMSDDTWRISFFFFRGGIRDDTSSSWIVGSQHFQFCWWYLWLVPPSVVGWLKQHASVSSGLHFCIWFLHAFYIIDGLIVVSVPDWDAFLQFSLSTLSELFEGKLETWISLKTSSLMAITCKNHGFL